MKKEASYKRRLEKEDGIKILMYLSPCMLLYNLIYGPIFITPRAFRISLLFWGHCFNYDELFKIFSGNSSFSLVRTKSAAIIILFVMQ